MSDSPTILVKKTDGTQVRMTMEEFKLYVRNTKDAKVRKNNNSDPDNVKQITDNIKAPELQNIKTDSKQISELRTLNSELGTPNDLPAKVQNEALSTTAPVKEVFVNEARAVVLDNKKQITNNIPAINTNSTKPINPVIVKKDWQNLILHNTYVINKMDTVPIGI